MKASLLHCKKQNNDLGFFPFFLSFELTVALYGNKLSAKE